MRLPRGITGFRSSMKAPPLPETDVKALRGHCYIAAQIVSGKVLGFEDPYQLTNNFATGTISLEAGLVAVLLNAHFPWIGFAQPPAVGEFELRFVESMALVEVFRNFGVYEVLDRVALEQTITEDIVADLANGERSQFKYWKPKRVGDVIFNNWD